MECHKCEHRAAIEAGKFRKVAFDQTPCGSCVPDAVPSLPVEFDEGRAVAGEAIEECPSVPEAAFPEEALPEPEPPASLSARYPVGAFLHVVMSLFALSDTDLVILRLYHRGMSREQVAAQVGLSVKASSMRFFRILRRYPVLLAMFPHRRSVSAGNRAENGG